MDTRSVTAPICLYFNSPGGCRFGESCFNRHVRQPNEFRQICKYFGGPLGCRFGESCLYRHELPDGASAEGPRGETVMTGRARCTSDTSSEITSSNSTSGASDVSSERATEKSDSTVDLEGAAAAGATSTPRSKGKAPAGNAEKRQYGPTKAPNKKCSCCHYAVNTEDLVLSFSEHYKETLLKKTRRHLNYFKDKTVYAYSIWCGCCCKLYDTIHGFFSHMKSKIDNRQRQVDCEVHKQLLDLIVKPFVDFELGFITFGDCNFRHELMLISDYIMQDDDRSSTAYLERLKEINGMDDVHLELEYERSTSKRDVDDARTLARWCRRLRQIAEYDSDSDSDDWSYGCGFGFSQDDEFELMCQFIKPWESGAGDALDAIYGGYD